MRRNAALKKNCSIRFLLWIFTMVLLLLFVSSVYYVNTRQQELLLFSSAENQSENLNSFVDKMDEQLRYAEEYIYNNFLGNRDIDILKISSDDFSRHDAKERLEKSLSNLTQLNEFAECAFLYIPDGQKYSYMARTNYTGLGIQELTRIKEYLIKQMKGPEAKTLLSDQGWKWIVLEEQAYLLWIAPVQDEFCGVLVSGNYLLTKLEEWVPSFQGQKALLSDYQGKVLCGSNSVYREPVREQKSWSQQKNGLIHLKSISEEADFTAEVFLTEEDILEGQYNPYDYAVTVAILLLFMLVAFYLFQFGIFSLFRKLLQEMKFLKNGIPVRRVSEDSRLLEVAEFGHTINVLLDENLRLSKEIYAAKLQERDIHCQYLQIRLKSHFYMNCLSIIRAMASTGKTELIGELSEDLIRYLRFTEQDTKKFVFLEKELEHVRNYARIQELRFPGVISYREDVPIELYGMEIPPLILQTFIENSVEHGLEREKKNWIEIHAAYWERNNLPGIGFCIQDSGVGFSEEDLKGFAEETASFDLTKSQGIGIRNVISRLELLYEGKAYIHFSNAQKGGARIEIWLPILETEKIEEERK